MNKELKSILHCALIPEIIALIIKNEGLDGTTAMREFYQSSTYAMLILDESKMWYYDPLTIYTMWKQEKEAHELLFPEE